MNTNKLLVGLMLSCIIILSCGQDLNCFDKELIRVTGSGENRVIPTIAIIYSTLSAEGSTA